MSTDKLDDLPLPEPDGYAAISEDGSHSIIVPPAEYAKHNAYAVFTADQIRADREMVWELAMRKAQEGREPVGEVVIRTYQAALGPVELATATLFTALPDGTKLYTSPPPKSSDARDALLAARDYVQQALNEHDRMYCRHPATESDRKLIVDDLARVDAALAAQQKGGE